MGKLAFFVCLPVGLPVGFMCDLRHAGREYVVVVVLDRRAFLLLDSSQNLVKQLIAHLHMCRVKRVVQEQR